MSPDRRRHRGPHPADEKDFDAENLHRLRQATFEVSWLLTQKYTLHASLALVGDHHGLSKRQRTAVSRAATSELFRQQRKQTRMALEDYPRIPIAIDGFNCLITLEAALSGGVILLGRDRCLRDLSGIHGSYRFVEETEPALMRMGEMLNSLECLSAQWFLDRPVSNSGRLASLLKALSHKHRWPWKLVLEDNVDHMLIQSHHPVVTSDSVILNRSSTWLGVMNPLVGQLDVAVWLVDLSGPIPS